MTFLALIVCVRALVVLSLRLVRPRLRQVGAGRELGLLGGYARKEEKVPRGVSLVENKCELGTMRFALA